MSISSDLKAFDKVLMTSFITGNTGIINRVLSLRIDSFVGTSSLA